MKKSEVQKGRKVQFQSSFRTFPKIYTVEIASDAVNWRQIPGLRPFAQEGDTGVLVKRPSAEGEPPHLTFVTRLESLSLNDDKECLPTLASNGLLRLIVSN